MPRHFTSCLALALSTTMLISCAAPGERTGPGMLHGGSTLNKGDIGTAIGAVGGGIVGSAIGGGAGQVVAIVGGALLGGALGNVIGNSLDNADRAAYDRASTRAMETGTRRTWSNPENGHHGSITPKRHYKDGKGRLCREYTQQIYVDGRKHTGHGTACRQSDGSWRIVNE